MQKLTSVEDLHQFRQRILVTDDPKEVQPRLVINAGTCGVASGASDILRIVKKTILERGFQEKLGLRITGCQGFCQLNPFLLVEPDGYLYPNLKMEDVPRIVEAAATGEVVEDLIYREPGHKGPPVSKDELPFFIKQTRTLLGANQGIDPIRIMHYFEQGGYQALEKVLAAPDPEGIIKEIKTSELRGRGGAGFPTGKKWELARRAAGGRGQKYVVCNADEGDPGAYMDRGILEGNPHAILEGMTIAGIAIGATKGFIYVRSEYPLAIKHVLIAIRQAHDLGLLGHDILGTGIDFDVEIIRGAGAFVCGEETALIRSIEGFMGEPRQRPPYPIERGVSGFPTCINNVETLANVPVIIARGAEEYAKVGIPGNRGTKIFSLVGKIRNTGLVEVPLGTRLREVIFDIGGGPAGKAKVKAVQTGGPSGGCIPASLFDISIDYDSLAQAGSIMGSGGMIVMDENTCMVDVAKYFMSFLKDESCGKCFTCRKGTQRMHELLDDISRGEGTLETLDLLEELALAVKDSTMCGLGQSAPNPVLSTLRYFRDEYLEHVVHKRCRAGVCQELVGAPCQSACPLDTEVWRYVAHIAREEYEEAYRAIRRTNPLPSVCARVCHHPCEDRCRAGTSGASPVAIRALKRFVVDRVDPSVFQPERLRDTSPEAPRVAVVGAGPSGLSAAHNLSLLGYRVTLFESEARPGGMLRYGIPAYRLPREVLDREIEALIDENVTLKCGTKLGRDFTLDGLLEDGFAAVYLALGAHRSHRLGLAGEEAEGIISGTAFLKAFNGEGRAPARGRVGVIGGGNSAVDAARVARRLEGVDQVTIIYRRTRQEMPAYEEEIEAALAEGIELRTLLTPTRLEVSSGKVAGLECVRNELGDRDASGRRRPVPQPGTEEVIPLDALIVAIGEAPSSEGLGEADVREDARGAVVSDPYVMSTSRAGVFAGGDLVTGPNTVVEALAAGRRAARSIDRYLRGEPLVQPGRRRVPTVYLEPVVVDEEERAEARRARPRLLDPERARQGFEEVELALTPEAARSEALRCLRCDLEFTGPAQDEQGAGREGGAA